jgi:hypothetical protein
MDDKLRDYPSNNIKWDRIRKNLTQPTWQLWIDTHVEALLTARKIQKVTPHSFLQTSVQSILFILLRKAAFERLALQFHNRQVKVKVHRRRRGIAPLILNLGTRWEWVVNFRPWPFYFQQKTGTQWTEGWVGPRTSGLSFENKKISCPDSNT